MVTSSFSHAGKAILFSLAIFTRNVLHSMYREVLSKYRRYTQRFEHMSFGKDNLWAYVSLMHYTLKLKVSVRRRH